MLKKILVALDGSENAERALPWVRQYAARKAAQVVLFRAFEERPEEAREYLGRMEKEINYAGIPCKTRIRHGNAPEAIVKAAVDERADLVMMTTRGGSPVKRWLIGGVTEQVLRLSPVPVLVVRSRTPMPKQGRVRRIIVPVDGSKLAETSIPWIRKLAALLRSRVVFLHVYPAGPLGLTARHEELFDALRKRMGRACAALRESGVRASFRLQRGDAAERILVFADAQDLLVTTSHGFGGFKRWVFGSVAEKLVHAAQIPVVVYKEPMQAKGQAAGVA
jgi:nucleotide-binding universal stress UspA family protein